MRDARFTYSANVSIMFTEHPLLDRPRAAAAAGFDSIEMWWPFQGPVAPDDAVSALVDAIADAGVSLTGLNFWAGDMAAGDRGVASHPDRAEELVANTGQLLQIAQASGCRHFNLLYGQRQDRWTATQQDRAATAAIRTAAAALAPIGGTVLLEPLASGLNGAYPLTHPGQIVERLRTSLAGSENVRLLFDTFHIGSNGVDIVGAVADLAPWIGHVQIADSPGRGEPGTGTLPIDASLSALAAAGYQGLVACEYKPMTATTEASLRWTERLP